MNLNARPVRVWRVNGHVRKIHVSGTECVRKERFGPRAIGVTAACAWTIVGNARLENVHGTSVAKASSEQQSTVVITACVRTVTGSVQTEAASNQNAKMVDSKLQTMDATSVCVRKGNGSVRHGPARHPSVRKAISTR